MAARDAPRYHWLMLISCHFRDCESASGHESDSCKQRYSKYPTFTFAFAFCVTCSRFLCSCSHHLEFPSLGYSKQFYHILFSPPTQKYLLQSSFSVFLNPIPPQPASEMTYCVSGGALNSTHSPHPSPAPQIRLAKSPTMSALQIHLLTYLLQRVYANYIKTVYYFTTRYCIPVSY